jgi:PAS domain S-box-containing protein
MDHKQNQVHHNTQTAASTAVDVCVPALDFQVLVDTLPHLIWVIKPDGTAEFLSQLWIEYTGLTLERTRGGGWIDIIHPDDRQRCAAQLEEAVRSGVFRKIEYRVKNVADDTYRWFLGQVYIQKDGQGNVCRLYGTATDINDQKCAEEMLIQANGFLRQFVSMVSHEFRTALTSIQGFSQLLQESTVSEEEVKDFAHDISTDALRLHRMITDLLDLEKMQSGQLVLNRAITDFNKLVTRVADQMRVVSAQHPVLTELDNSVPPLMLDQDKIIQVLINLLSNAIKYSPQGGAVRVASAVEDTMLHVYIEDKGMGIPTEALEKIFTPYNRIHSERTQFIQGTGLGLAIVRQIITLHGGNVWAESMSNRGSTFHFTLPIN